MALAFAGNAAAQSQPAKPYVVQLADSPAAAYAGGLPGYAATRVAPGTRLNVNAATVTAYLKYLAGKRQAVVASIKGVKPIQSYSVALNGFSAFLTDEQVKALQSSAGIASVQQDKRRMLRMATAPAFLGLQPADGVWSQLDPAAQKLRGENLVVGVIDTGIAPEHLAFSDRVDPDGVPTHDKRAALAYGPPPPRWKGLCEVGPGFAPSDCNHKLIGARSFNRTSQQLGDYEFASPRDSDGHGTLTASIAAGNERVPFSLRGTSGEISGIAPRARVAAYKACWSGGCMDSDVIAAVEQSIVDGVDVLNSSIDADPSYASLPELAFLNAAAAGIFVATSAGNGGPDLGWVTHIAPWLMSVAASNQSVSPGSVAPVVANWSSRGPNDVEFGILKPDITAPGVGILAGRSYWPASRAEYEAIASGTLRPASSFTYASGTSFSAPVVAGVAALVKQAHPSWSPAAIKSALMTSATRVLKSDGSPDDDRWAFGAGHVNPAGAIATDLVYDAGLEDFKRFLCYQQALHAAALDCSLGAIPAHQLNSPSLTALVPGRLSFSRRVTNVGAAYASYSATATLPGYEVVVSPSQLNLAPGETRGFTVQVTRTTAEQGSDVFGELVWSGGGKRVSSPLIVSGRTVVGPKSLSDLRARGTKVFSLASGEATGPMTTVVRGLVAAARTDAFVAPRQWTCIPIERPAGGYYLQYALYDADTRSADASTLIDLDLGFQFVPGGPIYNVSSTQATSNEKYGGSLEGQPPGVTGACAFNQSPVGAHFTLSVWIVPEVPVGNLRVAVPAKGIAAGTTASVVQSWSVAPGHRYFGLVDYFNDDGLLFYQYLDIDATGIPSAPSASTRRVAKRGFAFEAATPRDRPAALSK